MSQFEYIIGFHTIVLGLATGRILAVLADVIRYRSSVGHDWVHALWCVLVELMLIGWWYGLWRNFQSVDETTYGDFLVSFSITVSFYLAASLLHADIDEDPGMDLQAYFASVRIPFFLSLAYAPALGLLLMLSPELDLPSRGDGAFLLGLLTVLELACVVVAGLLLRARRGQQFLVLGHGAAFVLLELQKSGI